MPRGHRTARWNAKAGKVVLADGEKRGEVGRWWWWGGEEIEEFDRVSPHPLAVQTFGGF